MESLKINIKMEEKLREESLGNNESDNGHETFGNYGYSQKLYRAAEVRHRSSEFVARLQWWENWLRANNPAKTWESNSLDKREIKRSESDILFTFSPWR